MTKTKDEIVLLETRIESLEKELEKLKTVDPGIINERLTVIEDTLYSSKEMLNAKEVCHYLDISQSMLYKLTCSGEIPHFKPRGKMVFFEKKELVEWIKRNHVGGPEEASESTTPEPNDYNSNEDKQKKEQH